MFDAFVRFAYGIISHEASNQGGGGGSQSGYRGRAPTPPEEPDPPDDLHLAADSLSISRAFRQARAGPPEGFTFPSLLAYETPDPSPTDPPTAP